MEDDEVTNVFVAVHAGAGSHSPNNEQVYKATCAAACKQAMTLLKARGTAVEAVTCALTSLEDKECTNAGQGSNLTMEGTVECDASVMDGETLCFGAVGAISGVKNPTKVAKILVDEQRLGTLPGGRVRPSILVGKGAQDFCIERGIDIKRNLISKSSFKMYNRYKRKCQQSEMGMNKRHKPDPCETVVTQNGNLPPVEEECPVQDTVGAVCVDCHGNVAAASSSGGIWLKHSGRLGVAAVYGAGCWAQNEVSPSKPAVAAVTTGCGEHIMQTLLAKTCCAATRSSEDFSSDLHAAFKDDFMESEFLKNIDEKFGGILILRASQTKENTRDEKGKQSPKQLEMSWVHSTPSMCLGYMDGTRTSPTTLMSRLGSSAVPGSSFTMGGAMKLLH